MNARGTRVFVPATVPGLRAWLAAGSLPVSQAHAVTPRLRAALPEANEEELEYLAMQDAADACLRLLAEDPGAARRRLLLAGDLPVASTVSPPAGDEPLTMVRIGVAGRPRMSDMVSLLVDDADACDAVARACELLAGDPAELAQALDDLAGFDMMWFDISELDTVVRLGS